MFVGRGRTQFMSIDSQWPQGQSFWGSVRKFPGWPTNTKRVTTHQERWLCGTGRSSRCGASEVHFSNTGGVFVSSVMGWYGMIWNVSHELRFASCQVKVSFWDLSVDRWNVIRPPKRRHWPEFDEIGTYKTSMKIKALQAMHHLRQPEGIQKKTTTFFLMKSRHLWQPCRQIFFCKRSERQQPNDIEVKTYQSLSLAFDCTTVVQLGLGVKSEVLKSFQVQALGV